MLNWLKRKKPPVVEKLSMAQPTRLSREDVVATAMKNMQETRDIIGEEKLQKLAEMILNKKIESDDISPAAQAKKIIAQMDKDRLGDFMKLMVQDTQTKH